MINKQNLWFITLFSLIMVLSIYYLTMSDNTLANLKVSEIKNEPVSEVVVSENETLVALKVAEEEALVAKTEELQNIILSDTATLEEKNKAYEDLQNLNKNESSKEAIEKVVKEKLNLDCVVTLDGNNINVTIASTDHDAKLANNIIRNIQSLYDETKYITVKFS